MSQEDVARSAGCTLKALGRIERGEEVPRVYLAQRIAAAVGATVADLWPVEGGAR